MVRLTRGLGADPALPPGGRGRYDSDLESNYVYDQEGWALQAGRNGERCVIVSSHTLNQFEIETSWVDAGAAGRGYNTACDCYCPGYRPSWTPPRLVGLGAPNAGYAYSTVPRTQGRPPFRVCAGRNIPSEIGCRECTSAAVDCPTCPPLPATPPAFIPDGGTGAQDWGVNIAWLAAGAVVAGGGYYAYRRGVFKKRFWKGKK